MVSCVPKKRAGFSVCILHVSLLGQVHDVSKDDRSI